MVRKGRFNISILVVEEKIDAAKAKIVTTLTNLRNTGDIESAALILESLRRLISTPDLTISTHDP